MEKKQKNKWLSFLADGMLSGLMIGIGCVVSMSCENRYLGISVLAGTVLHCAVPVWTVHRQGGIHFRP